MEFNSQVCTTKIQSKRLLTLGLKRVTADMYYHCIVCNEYPKYMLTFGSPAIPLDTPAWSLHRLIELCGIERLPICFGKKGKVRIRVSHIHPTHDGRSGYNHYDSLIDCIEWLIKEGYFNKEYLEE